MDKCQSRNERTSEVVVSPGTITCQYTIEVRNGCRDDSDGDNKVPATKLSKVSLAT